ncbi:MAG: T9SS type A sorting domain-containing protein [Bacteroidota bacterium]
MKRIQLTFLILIFSMHLSEAQIVSLDTAFGLNGKTQNRFPGWQSGILASKLQSDGKIVVCGFRTIYLTGDSDTILGRYNGDGTLDTTFGTNGFVVIDDLFIDGTSPKRHLIQPDGKIVVTGAKWADGEGLNFHTYRFNSNGTPDATFGTNGLVITDIDSSLDEATTVLLQEDNKIIVLGTYSIIGNIRYLCAVRYNSDGTTDTAFGTNGNAMFGSLAANYSNQLTDAFLETNGKIVMGAHHDIDGELGNFVVARFNADGTIDTGFGTNGARITNFGNDDKLMAIQKINNQYYAFGYSTIGGDETKMAIARYSTSGSLDFSFGTNGKVLLHRNATSLYDFISDAKVIGDKIVCSGYGESENSTVAFNVDALLIRLNLDGSIDTSFNNTGYIMADFSNNQTDIFVTLEILPDGKIIAEGYATVSNDDSFLLAKYISSGLANEDFASGVCKVYPNPFSESITIESNNLDLTTADIELFDINGRKLSEFILDGITNTIPMNKNLAKGNYLLKITNGGKTKTIKIIKQ